MTRLTLKCLLVFVLLVTVGFAESDKVAEVRKKAEAGNEGAQINLGKLYAAGKGVSKDSTVAAKWYRRAAEQGNAQGQFYLGVAYENGFGVSKDLVEALSWYSDSHVSGYANAKFLFKRLENKMTGEQVAEAIKRAEARFGKFKKE